MSELRRNRAQAIARREGEDCFVSLVREYAEMGYTEYAVAHRLLGIAVNTMRSYLGSFGASVQFKRTGEPGWCRWDSPKEYVHKVVATRLKNGTYRIIELDGERLHLEGWSRKTGIHASTIKRRIDVYGWSIRDALTVPVRARMGAKNPYRPKHPRGALEWLFDYKNGVKKWD